MESQNLTDALQVAYGLIAKQDRTESEVRSCLVNKGFADEIVTLVMSRLRERRFVDDKAIAARLAAETKVNRLKGAHALQLKMERRGISGEVAQAAVASVRESEDEAIRALLAQRFPERRSQDRGKAGRYLIGRGFDDDKVREAVENHFGSESEGFSA